MTRAAGDRFLAHVREQLFGVGTRNPAVPRIGAEIELIPVHAATRRIVPIDRDGEPSSMPALRRVAASAGWKEQRSRKSGLPEFTTRTGGRISFEPGGQIEFASAPSESVSRVVRDLTAAARDVQDGLAEAGIDVIHAGIDPVNPIDDVPLQGTGERYQRMDAHFASIGPHGARMMRQSASIQVSIDRGDVPLDRWQLLNGMAPYLAAMFANASGYEGVSAAVASVRQQAWRHLDPSRTGLPFDPGCPVEAYCDFGMRAAWILGPVDRAPFPAFGACAVDGADMSAWEDHLTTLFPEVRPRGYFEVRSVDALDPQWYAAPLVMVAGIAFDAPTARAALELTGPPDASLLDIAARDGLANAPLAATAGDLARLAMQGCESLGPAVVAPDDLERAKDFFAEFTWAGRSPADARAAEVH